MRLSTLLVVLAVVTGCASLRPASSRHPAWLARVNGEEITPEGLKREFARHHVALDKIIGDEAEVRHYVDKVIERRLLLQEGRRMGLQDRSDVREIVANARADEMRALLLQDEVESKTQPTDEEARAVYDRYGDILDVRHVVVSKREEAESLRARIVAGADMEGIARERSIVPTAVQGGLLQVVWGGDPAREQVVYALKPGEVSAVFQSQAGWEVARVEKRTKVEELPPFAKVKQRIRATLQARARAVRKPRFLEEVRKRQAAAVLDCPVRPAELRRVLATGGADGNALADRPCATWSGGKLAFRQVAGRVEIAELEKLPAGQQEEMGRQIVRDLLDEEVLRAEAEARGYGARPDVVETVKKTEDDLVEDRLLRDYVLKGVEAKEEDLKPYYESHRADFVEPARYRLAQIAVETPEKAKEVQAKLAAGEPFEVLAGEYSKDARSKAEGGDVGEYTKAQLGREFERVAALKKGEVSEPIDAKNRYYLVKVVDVTPERPLKFEEAKDRVIRAIVEPHVAERTKKWLGQLRAAASIEVSEAAIREYSREKGTEVRHEEVERRKAIAERKAKGEAGPHDGPPDGDGAAAPVNPTAATTSKTTATTTTAAPSPRPSPPAVPGERGNTGSTTAGAAVPGSRVPDAR